MIHDGEDALLVDVSLCVQNAWRSPPWLRESGTIVMAVGYVESSAVCPECAREFAFARAKAESLSLGTATAPCVAGARAAREREPSLGAESHYCRGCPGPRYGVVE